MSGSLVCERTVPDIPELVIGGIVGHDEPFLIAGGGPANDPGSSNSGLHNRDEWAQFAFVDAVEVIGASRCN